jgi:hypothetical protein
MVIINVLVRPIRSARIPASRPPIADTTSVTELSSPASPAEIRK